MDRLVTVRRRRIDGRGLRNPSLLALAGPMPGLGGQPRVLAPHLRPERPMARCSAAACLPPPT